MEEFGVAEKWIQGATVCDPTGGDGVFLLALIDAAQSQGTAIDAVLAARLYLMERRQEFIQDFLRCFRLKSGRDFPQSNVFQCDVILDAPSIKVDILVGNPPWANFTDLDATYKELLKPYFLEYGLVQDTRALLLGASRVDISALVITRTVESLLNKNGEAVFFVPLSLFFSDSAHLGFRKLSVKNTRFSIKTIYDFADEPVFESIATRFGIAHFVRDAVTQFPLPYRKRVGGQWKMQFAAPLHGDASPLSVCDTEEQWHALRRFEHIPIHSHQVPRQGVNTCGANRVFIFDRYPSFLPEEFVYPLLTRECFANPDAQPSKFILLPHDRNSGRPLDGSMLRKQPRSWEYLNEHRDVLSNRKGTLINAWIKRGLWWACLGVGPYSFAPYKLVWEAFGRKEFNPVIVAESSGKPWQANQALHSFMPFHSDHEARAMLERFKDPLIEEYLLSLNMAGTCNWAQPGRVKKLLRVVDTDAILQLPFG
ncbi:MAG: SAM-dependent DNA methyltransferase [Candidatus Coatesbacteria bacterium]|nr:SAM-dependent DNA methyltransferase [Candidatus Coatesbacteria bacterium]